MPRDVLDGYKLYIDGTFYPGAVMSVTPPAIVSEVVEHQTPSAIGTQEFHRYLEAMELEIQTADYYAGLDAIASDHITTRNIIIMFNIARHTGAGKTDVAGQFAMRGRFKETEVGEFNATDSPEGSLMVSCDSYIKSEGGSELVNISFDPPRYIVNGVDLLAARTANLGG